MLSGNSPFALTFFLLPALASSMAMAQPAEVSEGTSVNLRRAGSANYPIVASLTAHTQVDVIETGRIYAHVTTSAGHDGWMLKSRLAFAQEENVPPPADVAPSPEDEHLKLQRMQDQRDALAAQNTLAMWLTIICSGVAFLLGVVVRTAYFNYHYGWLIASKQYTLHGRWKWILSWRH